MSFLSFRLGHPDGVSVEADKWAQAFRALGFRTRSVAGAGHADRILPGLAIDAEAPLGTGEVDDALADADLVVVENVCSLPLNRGAAETVARSLRGRAAILHHHDLPWQREATTDAEGFPPVDPAWAHVTVNRLSCRQLAARGVAAVTIPNCFDVDAPPGDRHGTRAALEIHGDDLLLVQPTRAIPRKNIPGGLRLAASVGATYWLVGPAEDGYGPELDRLLRAAPGRVLRGLPPGTTVADAYAAADAVVLPSVWEGFGNPTVESAVHRRALAVGRYPVAQEIAAYGFRWFPAYDPAPLKSWFRCPDPTMLEHNHTIARRHFSLASLERSLDRLVGKMDWAMA